AEQNQEPQQMQPIPGAGGRVGGDAAGVIVRDHHDDAGTEHREKREHPPTEAVQVVKGLTDPEHAPQKSTWRRTLPTRMGPRSRLNPGLTMRCPSSEAKTPRISGTV